MSYNLAYNQNKIVKISDELDNLQVDQSRTQNAYIYQFAGQPYGMIAGYKEKRDDKGNVVYNSSTGLPMQSEFMALGRGVPPLTMGLTNTFNYRNFSFSFLIDAKFGSKIYSATNVYGTINGLTKETLNGREGGITLTGVNENGDAFSRNISAQTYYTGIASRITDHFIYDGSFSKLRQLTFGYSLPKKVLTKTPIQSVSLSLVARNLLILFKHVPNTDPESNYNSGNGQGLEMFGVPPARSYGLNLMVKF